MKFFFSINNFKSRKNVMKFFFSISNFKRKKVTFLRVLLSVLKTLGWDLFRMVFFVAAHGWGPPERSSSIKSVTHILLWWNSAVIPYLKKIQKTYKSHDTPLEFYWHQQFFTRNQQNLLYQEIQIQIAFWYIISNSFNFSRVFKHCFNKHGYNFDDGSKNGWPRPS